jgi:hypothetical protein
VLVSAASPKRTPMNQESRKFGIGFKSGNHESSEWAERMHGNAAWGAAMKPGCFIVNVLFPGFLSFLIRLGMIWVS